MKRAAIGARGREGETFQERVSCSQKLLLLVVPQNQTREREAKEKSENKLLCLLSVESQCINDRELREERRETFDSLCHHNHQKSAKKKATPPGASKVSTQRPESTQFQNDRITTHSQTSLKVQSQTYLKKLSKERYQRYQTERFANQRKYQIPNSKYQTHKKYQTQ